MVGEQQPAEGVQSDDGLDGLAVGDREVGHADRHDVTVDPCGDDLIAGAAGGGRAGESEARVDHGAVLVGRTGRGDRHGRRRRRPVTVTGGAGPVTGAITAVGAEAAGLLEECWLRAVTRTTRVWPTSLLRRT